MNPFTNQAPIAGVKNIFLVGSGKGGVGKSTLALNLAFSLKNLGRSVGLLDADIYGPSIPRMTGTQHLKPEVSPQGKIQPLKKFSMKLMSIGFLIDEASAVVWRGPMLFKAIEQFFRDVDWGELDDLVIDLPPGTGDVALTIAQKVPVTGAIVVCTPQNIALADCKKAIDMFERINVPLLGVIENMAYFQAPGSLEQTDLFPRGELDTYLRAHHIEKLARLGFDPQIGVACEAGIPFIDSDPESGEAVALRDMARKLIDLRPK